MRRIYLISPRSIMALVLFVCTIGIFPFCSRPDQIAPSPSHSPFCPPLSGLEDALVILKTGATEALQKLPVHFQTTLRCVPHHVIFSDFEEVIAGREVHDSLDEVNKTIVDTSSPEFDLYRRLQSSGRDGLTPEESTVRTDGAAWKLDKWKFLPIIDKAIRRKPDARWYVFMEADTYISWTNLQHYIARLNASEMHYIGNQMEITQQLFAHGGSGFIVSNPAMRAASERRASQLPDYDRYTADQWAGDCVLGKAMEDIGSPILWAWPMFQGLTPSTLDYNGEAYFKRLWCYPAITYHHIGGDDIKSLFKFEREMYSQVRQEAHFACPDSHSRGLGQQVFDTSRGRIQVPCVA